MRINISSWWDDTIERYATQFGFCGNISDVFFQVDSTTDQSPGSHIVELFNLLKFRSRLFKYSLDVLYFLGKIQDRNSIICAQIKNLIWINTKFGRQLFLSLFSSFIFLLLRLPVWSELDQITSTATTRCLIMSLIMEIFRYRAIGKHSR